MYVSTLGRSKRSTRGLDQIFQIVFIRNEFYQVTVYIDSSVAPEKFISGYRSHNITPFMIRIYSRIDPYFFVVLIKLVWNDTATRRLQNASIMLFLILNISCRGSLDIFVLYPLKPVCNRFPVRWFFIVGLFRLLSSWRLVLNVYATANRLFDLKYYFSNRTAILAFFKFSGYPFWM